MPAIFRRPLLLTLIVGLFLQVAASAVELGIDRLQQMDFAPLQNKRVGLITNQTGINSAGVKTRLILSRAHNVKLVALFSPEHGLDGTANAGSYVASRRDPTTGLTVFSLYGPTRKPTPAMLRGLDCLVYDMQDIGCRSYTYISTMARCMEAAGEAGIEFVVLDRPNPLGGLRVEGPPIEPQWISFVGQLPVPYVHGLTAGELARMTNGKGWMAARCRLSVIEMRGWSRNMVWADTGLRWIPTSPNIPRASSPAYYVVTGLVGELGGVETACGTSTPFEVFATRSASAGTLTRALSSMNLSGISFSPYSDGGWQGVRLRIDPHAGANLCVLGMQLFATANRASRPNLFARSSGEKLDIFYKCYGSRSIRSQLELDTPLPQIIGGWQRSLAQFRAARGPYLLY